MQIKQKYKNSMNKGLSHNKGPFAADQGGPLLWEATGSNVAIRFDTTTMRATYIVGVYFLVYA